jgi:hypothetical protein
MLYLISISGLAINTFYCCGKFKESYLLTSKFLPKNCKGNKLPGCCDTKTVLLKVKDKHAPSVSVKSWNSDFFINLFTFKSKDSNVDYRGYQATLLSCIHAPPLLSKQPVFLAVNNFRI